MEFIWKKAKAEVYKESERNTVPLDDIDDWAVEIKECVLNFENYRAHLVLHKADIIEFRKWYIQKELDLYGYYVELT